MFCLSRIVCRQLTNCFKMKAQNTVLMLMILTMFSRSNGKIFLHESEGNFSSSFDESGKNVNQDWVIQVPSGRIELTFDSFSFSTSDTKCELNFVKVHDVEKRNETFLRFRLCGGKLPHKIISSSNTLFIEFKVDNTRTQWAQFTAIYSTIRDNDIEYEILRDEETWEGAFSKCRQKNGYLVKASNEEDRNRLRQYIRANEEVWVGTYTTPWLWTRDCVKYEYKEDEVINITRNHAAECQQHCGTDNVWLQHSLCLCKQSDAVVKKVSYKRCNMLCKGDRNDVCGGDGVFMRYQKWVTSNPTLTGISNHDKNCIAYLKFDGKHLWKWKTVKCDSKRQTMCRKKSNQMSSAYNILPTLMQYTNAVNACLSEQKMIPDIQYDTFIPSEDKKKIHQSKGIWVGLRRRRVSVSNDTVNVKVEKSYNACYYLVSKSKQKLSTHIGNCSQRRPYYCKKFNFTRTSEKSPTQTITGFKPSTMATDRDHTHSDAPSMDNGTFEELTTLRRSLSTSVNGVTMLPEKAGFPVKFVVFVGAGILVLIVVIIIAVVCYRRRKRKNNHMQVAFQNVTYDAATGTGNALIHGRDMLQAAGHASNNKDYSYAEAVYPANANIAKANDAQNEEDGTYNLPGEIPTNADAVVNHYSQELPTNGEYSELPVKGGEKSRAQFDPYSDEKPENDTYNVLPVKGGPKPDPSFNPYAEEAPDNDTYNVLPVLGGPKVREEFDPYSDEKPDNDTYNVLPVKGQPKTNNDAIDDIYDHTGDNAETSQNVPMM